jgi:hypothetical protein
VREGNISPMTTASVTSFPRGRRRGQRLELGTAVPPRPDSSRGGRAWINGREVGGTAERFAHLETGHD